MLGSFSLADVSHILPEYATTTTSTPPPPPSPYNFQYSAGRYPGHIDRVHQEAGDGVGNVHGKKKKEKKQQNFPICKKIAITYNYFEINF